MLNYPIKVQNSIPNILIYTVKKPLQNGSFRYYSKMFNLKSGKVLACMNSEKELVERENATSYSLYVDVLKCIRKRQGFGTKMMKFAENLSRRLGCNGNIHLIASSELSPREVPHIFYRKYGMNSGNYEYDRKMDKFIRKNKKATIKDFPSRVMYYPPIKYNSPVESVEIEESSNLWQSIIKFFKI